MNTIEQTRVARDRRYGGGKYHVIDAAGLSVCGAEPSCPGWFADGSRAWAVTGSRADFERVVPERICKRCLNAQHS